MSEQQPDAGVRGDMRRALTTAMKARDMTTVRAIRSALGAIDNAEAVDSTVEPDLIDADSTIAGAVAGAGSTELRRRTLDDDDIDALLRAEIADRLAAVEEYRAAGATDRADLLDAEADVISTFLR
ncbi:MAG: hypothetical protein ABWZ99_01440 [Ilumatobacteraceae bacterium]